MRQQSKHALMDFKTAYSAAVIFSLVTYVSCSGSITSSSNVTTAQVNNTAKMEWEVVPGDNQRISALELLELGVNAALMFGVENPAVLPRGKELFGDRLTATFNATGHKRYIVEIRNILLEESITFILRATFRKKIDDKLDGEFQYGIRLNVIGSPTLCGRNLESKYAVNENGTLSVVQVICGHPKPEVKWKVGDDNFSKSYNSSEISTQFRRYKYSFGTRPITRKDCGKDIKFIANNSIGHKTGSATIDVTFKPKVLFKSAKINNTGCILIKWYRENTGKCNISYHLQFAGRETIYNTSNTYFTLCNATDVKTVTIQASYKGNVGKEVTRRISTTTPPPTTTTTTPNGGDKKSNIGLIVGIVGGILFVIIMIIIIVCVLKNKKKNGTGNHSGYAMRVTGEENNYVTDPTRSNRRQPANPDDPEQAIYSELGPGGGRTGPRPAPEQSDYAEMKVDAMGYPIDGAKASEPPTYAPVIKPREGAKRRTPSPPRSNVDGARAAASSEPPAYAPIMKNRSSSRGRSPPPDEDDHEGVIV